jgi:hypothetical protein
MIASKALKNLADLNNAFIRLPFRAMKHSAEQLPE